MMPTNKDEFLKSGLLEQYVMGLCSVSERELVEQFISQYDSVRQDYEELQQSISELADSYAISPPADVKGRVMEALQTERGSDNSRSRGKFGSLAIGLAAAIALLGVYTVVTVSELQSELKSRQAEYTKLLADCEQSQLQAAAVEEQLQFYSSSDTKIAELSGGEVLPGFEAVTHYNKSAGQYTLDIVELGNMPEGKCLYLWGDKDGKMIKLQRVAADDRGQLMVFDSRMESFNLTLEDASAVVDHPDVNSLVASTAI